MGQGIIRVFGGGGGALGVSRTIEHSMHRLDRVHRKGSLIYLVVGVHAHTRHADGGVDQVFEVTSTPPHRT